MNFTFEELIASKTAEKYNLNNKPLEVQHYTNLMMLVVDVLQPIRNYFKTPVIICSGYRRPALNQFVGGVSTSQHLTGNAVDFYVKGKTLVDILKAIKELKLNYDQILVYNKKGFIHYSLKSDNNRKELKYV